MKFVHTKVHNGNRNGELCLTSSEIMTLQLKMTLSLCLTFTLLRVLGNVSFTDSVALNSLSWVDLIFLLHLSSSAGCVFLRIYVTHHHPTMFLVIPGNPDSHHARKQDLEQDQSLLQTNTAVLQTTSALHGEIGSATMLTFYLLLTVHRIA